MSRAFLASRGGEGGVPGVRVGGMDRKRGGVWWKNSRLSKKAGGAGNSRGGCLVGNLTRRRREKTWGRDH